MVSGSMVFSDSPYLGEFDVALCGFVAFPIGVLFCEFDFFFRTIRVCPRTLQRKQKSMPSCCIY